MKTLTLGRLILAAGIEQDRDSDVAILAGLTWHRDVRRDSEGVATGLLWGTTHAYIGYIWKRR